MKIFFTLEPPKGSYGGGAFFVKNMIKFLIEKGHTITHILEKDIGDLILLNKSQLTD